MFRYERGAGLWYVTVPKCQGPHVSVLECFYLGFPALSTFLNMHVCTKLQHPAILCMEGWDI